MDFLIPVRNFRTTRGSNTSYMGRQGTEGEDIEREQVELDRRAAVAVRCEKLLADKKRELEVRAESRRRRAEQQQYKKGKAKVEEGVKARRRCAEGWVSETIAEFLGRSNDQRGVQAEITSQTHKTALQQS